MTLGGEIIDFNAFKWKSSKLFKNGLNTVSITEITALYLKSGILENMINALKKMIGLGAHHSPDFIVL